MTTRVEYLVAWEDGTWTTTVPLLVPVEYGNDQEAVNYANEHLIPLETYRKAVLFAVYAWYNEVGTEFFQKLRQAGRLRKGRNT